MSNRTHVENGPTSPRGKPPPDVLMDQFDRLPYELRRIIANHEFDCDPAGALIAIRSGKPVARILDHTRRAQRELLLKAYRNRGINPTSAMLRPLP